MTHKRHYRLELIMIVVNLALLAALVARPRRASRGRSQPISAACSRWRYGVILPASWCFASWC